LHPNWIDGRSYIDYPTEFNKSLKNKIRKRDNYQCQNCNITEKEHLLLMNWSLTVHHIDYNRLNSNITNLITLCHQCNIRANYKRTYWQTHYTNKINSYYLGVNNA
jgi:5-methylcytosine-specific restriction endonuclease McrA